MRIATGITTAPRQPSTFVECVQSAKYTGFDPIYVFADNYEPQLNVEIIARPQTIAPPIFDFAGSHYGAWRNWVQGLADLIEAEPDADAYLMLQDDVRFCRGVREFLDDGHWRIPGVGLVTLHTSSVYRGIARSRGMNRLDSNRAVIAGACTLLMPADVARRVRDHKLSQDETGWHVQFGVDPSRVKKIDMYIGTIMIEAGLSQWGYRPSLAEHFATVSTLDNGGNTGPRQTLSFAGQTAVAAEVFSNGHAG